jgi:hypothetical protein
MRSIYQRPKVRLPDGRAAYRYTAVDMGQGIRTGKLKGPFYILRLKNWVKLDADTFAEAKLEAEVKFAALDAADKGLTVAEADNIDFMGCAGGLSDEVNFDRRASGYQGTTMICIAC